MCGESVSERIWEKEGNPPPEAIEHCIELLSNCVGRFWEGEKGGEGEGNKKRKAYPNAEGRTLDTSFRVRRPSNLALFLWCFVIRDCVRYPSF